MLLVSRLAEGPSTAAPVLRFSLVSGFISYVVPNFLTFAAIPHLGSGLVAIMFAPSPVVTALAVDRPEGAAAQPARPCRHRRGPGWAPSRSSWRATRPGRGTVGAGCCLPHWCRCSSGSGMSTAPWPGPGEPGRCGWRRSPTWRRCRRCCWPWPGRWVASTFPRCSPCRDWSASSLLASSAHVSHLLPAAAVGGPTYLSQIGYVAAAVGVGIGVGVLGESLSGGRLGGRCHRGGGHRADDAGPIAARQGPEASPLSSLASRKPLCYRPRPMQRPGHWLLRGRGEIGRHAGFRFLWGNPWGFKSLRPHQRRPMPPWRHTDDRQERERYASHRNTELRPEA